MIILGIDPGTIRCGYSIIECEKRVKLINAGLIKFSSTNLQEQLIELEIAIDDITKRYMIDEVCIEDIFFAYNPKSVLKLAQFRGALSLKILQLYKSFYEYTPLQVKRALTGNGKASKEQVEFMVRKILNLKKEIKPYDISDAIAISLTHCQRKKQKN